MPEDSLANASSIVPQGALRQAAGPNAPTASHSLVMPRRPASEMQAMTEKEFHQQGAMSYVLNDDQVAAANAAESSS